MAGLLRIGQHVTSEYGNKYEICSLLGAGGQGEVYEVVSVGKKYALKCYFEQFSTKKQRKLLDNLIKKGEPNASFLWPKELVDINEKTVGYIMPLRSQQYKGIVDLMKRRAEPSFYALIKAAYNLTKGYDKLHYLGFCYRDISFGNVFFNPDTGDVLICDNDNVSAVESGSAVYGTPRFMAPEIVLGRQKPSRNTDLYSLAVLLFYMLMLNHPLEGKREAAIKCLDIEAMKELYGKNPVFIFDPTNTSNRPLAGYHDNAIEYWNLYPTALKELFTQSFTTGLSDPNRRITENQWLDVFVNLMSEVIECPSCKAEVFYDDCKTGTQQKTICWNCKTAISMPSVMHIGKSKIILKPDTVLTSHHIHGDYDMDKICGRIVLNPQDNKTWGIRNETNENWTCILSNGIQIPVGSGKSVAIGKEMILDFGQLQGKF